MERPVPAAQRQNRRVLSVEVKEGEDETGTLKRIASATRIATAGISPARIRATTVKPTP